MNRIHHIGRLAGALTGLASGLLALAAPAPAALAANLAPQAGGGPPPGISPITGIPGQNINQPRPGVRLRAEPPGWNKHPPLPGPARDHTVVIHTVTGMPGWQIALIAIVAALAAAAMAVLLDRARAARRRGSTTAASGSSVPAPAPAATSNPGPGQAARDEERSESDAPTSAVS